MVVQRKIDRDHPSSPIINAMTVDVEDYFQVSAFEQYVSKESWSKLPSRVERNMDSILALFDKHGVKATFFTLGWVAEHHPHIVKAIVSQGHELASHGWEHVRVTEQNQESFSNDVRRTKHVLEDLSGTPVRGYRAATYSINHTNLWAHDVLAKEGYEYSSSIVPIKHDLYGIPDAPRFAHRAAGSEILEIPISTVCLLGKNYSCGGGGWFRLYPYFISRWAIKYVNEKEREPCVFYFHPWEFDPAQPRQSNIDQKTKFRHYLNLSKMENRVDQLLSDFRWGKMDRVYLGHPLDPMPVISESNLLAQP